MRGPKPVLILKRVRFHPIPEQKEVQTRLEKKKLNVVRTSRTCTKRLLF